MNYALMACFHSNNSWPDLIHAMRVFQQDYLDDLEKQNRDRGFKEWSAE
jgi:hypothetical protein